MIRNIVIHLSGEQPLVADAEALPSPSDVTFVCNNLRHVDGKKPRFIDHTDSTFVFPMSLVRFLEIPKPGGPGNEFQLLPGPIEEDLDEDEDLEPDEDFLRRIREA